MRQEHFGLRDVLIPASGLYPPERVSAQGAERVLHVALDSPLEKQPSLCQALGTLGPYRHLDWVDAERRGTLARDVVAACGEFLPTLVFMQLQRRSPITPDVVRQMKAAAARPELVIANWDGDMHYEPTDAGRSWFVELGRACDTSLVTCTNHPLAYQHLGVRMPGYLQIGVDDRYFAPGAPPRAPVPDVVLLAGRYDHVAGYERRLAVVEHLAERLGPRFGVYGNGWRGPSARPFVLQDEEPPIYRGARAAISISRICDTPRYSSDRLFRIMASGGLPVVEEFPDMEGLGLYNGSTCWTWKTIADLDRILSSGLLSDATGGEMIRRNARAAAAMLHTWDVRMGELAAILEAVRATR